MGNYVDGRSPFLRDKLYQCTELPNLDDRKCTRDSTRTTSSCKDHCVVRVYSIMYYRTIFVSRKRVLSVLLPLASLVKAMSNRVFCAITSFQIFNCVGGIICMQDDASPHIAHPMKPLLKSHLKCYNYQPSFTYSLATLITYS